MTEHDLLEVVEIEESCALSRWGWDAYREELGRPESMMYVARWRRPNPLTERLVAGFLAARVTAGEMHINNVGVIEQVRGRGIASELLSVAVADALSRGVVSAVLEVRAGNMAAQSLYRRHGFEIAGRRRDYYSRPTEDALVMTAAFGRRA
ncbi:MAG: ribosomal protein S18-alanine N-acetyltransferase [Pyrinomonadaceae bacterium]|nr:ribosomal protein S18-alanine N-acetyltransferase [Pyrinomonadaceae bacterium]